MSVTAIIGAQWGDEGKGKIVDYYCQHLGHQMVIRSQGGNNAGHTLILEKLENQIIKEEKLVLRIVPTGIINPKILSIIGHGVVIDPVTLLEEISNLQKMGMEINPSRLLISECAHLIMPWHRLLDRQTNQIGTTGNGIGPAYAAKAYREGIRMGDFKYRPQIAFEKMHALNQRYSQLLKTSSEELSSIFEKYRNAIMALMNDYSEIITDVHPIIQRYLREERGILLEGAQGVMLDLDLGTYPFVTSSNTLFSGLCWGAGIAPQKVDKITGVFKAYTTRVGDGPFPTEDNSDYGEKLQTLGHEYGSVTGRKRRCGHLDLVLLKYASDICGFNDLVMTKFDIIYDIDEMKIAHAYMVEDDFGKVSEWNSHSYPHFAKKITPIYKTFTHPRENRHQIINFIENYLQRKISLISLGPKRDEVKLAEAF